MKDTVGTAMATATDLLTTLLSLPVVSIILIVNVWLPLVQEVASRLQPNPRDPS